MRPIFYNLIIDPQGQDGDNSNIQDPIAQHHEREAHRLCSQIRSIAGTVRSASTTTPPMNKDCASYIPLHHSRPRNHSPSLHNPHKPPLKNAHRIRVPLRALHHLPLHPNALLPLHPFPSFWVWRDRSTRISVLILGTRNRSRGAELRKRNRLSSP